MNRYEQLKEVFFKEIEKNCFGIYKQKAYFHSIQVCTLCQIYAKKRHLNIELASIIGLFHDYSQFIYHHSFNHAVLSSEMTEKILNSYNFSKEEIHIIVTAIRLHSHKEQIDDDYRELIKDDDLIVKYYEDPEYIFKPYENKRIQHLLITE